MKKILVTGNPDYGTAKGINEVLDNCDFCSRTNGYDLSKEEKQKKLAELSLNYDVFIACSTIWDAHQMNYVIKVVKKWQEKNHKGQIIVFGSGADTYVKGTTWEYPAFKKGLRAYCRQISSLCGSTDPNYFSTFRLTYLSPGNIATPKQQEKMPGVNMLQPTDLGNVVKWLINQPDYINISEICLDRFQVEFIK